MKKLLWLVLLAVLTLTACSAFPQQLDTADEAILRTVTLSRQGELTLRCLTAGGRSGDTAAPPELVEGRGTDFAEARADLMGHRTVSFSHATDWVAEEEALPDLLGAFLVSPELTLRGRVYILKDQTAEEFLDAFPEQESARSLEQLFRARRGEEVTAMDCLSRLAEGQGCRIPLIRGEQGQVEVCGWREVKGQS